MKIYTKTGDKGETKLFGGEQVSKDNLRIDAYGTVDELNAVIGLAITEIIDYEIRTTLLQIQNHLFILGSDLASPRENENNGFEIPRIQNQFAVELEKKIDHFDEKLPELRNFILPGGLKGSALLHLARTVCRRAERKVVRLSKSASIGDDITVFLNRLSDLLFVLARYENFVNNTEDVKWQSK